MANKIVVVTGLVLKQLVQGSALNCMLVRWLRVHCLVLSKFHYIFAQQKVCNLSVTCCKTWF